MQIKVVSGRTPEDFEIKLREAVKGLSGPKLSPGEIKIIPMGIAVDILSDESLIYTAIVTKE